MKDNIHKVHWISGLMSINPERIHEHLGTIVGTIFDEQKAMLSATIRSNDNLPEQPLILTYNYFDEKGLEKEKTKELPDSVRNLYNDFNVSNPSELVGKRVNGLYFLDRLVGIQRR